MVGKFEKIAATLIIAPFVGTLLGFTFALFFGGRGGMVFTGLGLVVGAVTGLAMSILLGVKYNPENSLAIISPKRLLFNRIFVVFLYILAIYTVVVVKFFPEL